MIGGIIGAAIVILAVALLALCLMRRRRRNQEIRTFIVASPDPFPHTAKPSPQATSSSSPPPGLRRMTIQTVAPTSMPRATFSDLGLPNMTENTNDRAPSTVTRKKPVPFLNDLDLGMEDRLSVRSVSPFSISPGQDHARPVAAEDPFTDPVRNPFEDPRPAVPAVVVHPATPRHSGASTLSESKVCRFFLSTDTKIGD